MNLWGAILEQFGVLFGTKNGTDPKRKVEVKPLQNCPTSFDVQSANFECRFHRAFRLVLLADVDELACCSSVKHAAAAVSAVAWNTPHGLVKHGTTSIGFVQASFPQN